MEPTKRNGTGPDQEPKHDGALSGGLPRCAPLASKFPLGRLVMTRGVAHEVAPEHVLEVLERHARGDWGDLDAEDKKANEQALEHGDRVLSAYWIASAQDPDGEVRLYVITEADRSVTTVLLTNEY